MGLLFKIIIIGILIYYLIKIVFKTFRPSLTRFFFKFLEKQFNKFFINGDNKEGEILVNKKNNTNKKDYSGKGEYIDYEEVKD